MKERSVVMVAMGALLAVSAGSIWAGTYSGGTGEPNDPYRIATAEDLNDIGNHPNDWDKHFVMVNDVNLADYTGTQYKIIGTLSEGPFKGVFDGNAHTISNFTYTDPNAEGLGLFGEVLGGAQIKNVGVVDANLIGDLFVGGLASTNSGSIENCYVTGRVQGRGGVGGLVRANFGTVSACYSTAAVFGSTVVGGLIADNWDTVVNCYAAGPVDGNDNTGGLVGKDYSGTVLDSFWDIGTSGQTTSAGGTGKTTAEMQTATTFIAWACDPSWTINNENDYPRLAWEDRPGVPIVRVFFDQGSGTEPDPYRIRSAEQLNMIGLFNCMWDKHFMLVADLDLSGFTGTEFNCIGYGYWAGGWVEYPFTGVFDGNGHTVGNFSYASDYRDYVGLFGCLGASAEVRDLGMISPEVSSAMGWYVGSLAGRVSGGTISNCWTEGGSVVGESVVGGLIGSNVGHMGNCHAAVSVSNYYGSFVGGLVGYSAGHIANCSATGSVTGDYGASYTGGLAGDNSGDIANSYATAAVSGEDCTGGLAGENAGHITNCYASGNVWGMAFADYVGGLVGFNGGTVTNGYSMGLVWGSPDAEFLGGLVGESTGRVTYSYWDLATSGQSASAGGEGKSTAEMQTRSTFTDAGWDFVGEAVNGPNDVWRMCVDGENYPLLSWEFTSGDFVCPDGVDFVDYSFFAQYWRDENCGTSNDCRRTDLDLSGAVGWGDLKILCDHWLEGVGL